MKNNKITKKNKNNRNNPHTHWGKALGSGWGLRGVAPAAGRVWLAPGAGSEGSVTRRRDATAWCDGVVTRAREAGSADDGSSQAARHAWQRHQHPPLRPEPGFLGGKTMENGDLRARRAEHRGRGSPHPPTAQRPTIPTPERRSADDQDWILRQK